MQKKAKLTNNQFYFDARHPYANAKKKLPCLKRLPELTNDMVCILKEMQTVTIVYKLSVTNLEFTLGLTENIDMHGEMSVASGMRYIMYAGSILMKQNVLEHPPVTYFDEQPSLYMVAEDSLTYGK